MNNQEASDALAEKLKATMQINESKTDKTKDHVEVVSMKIEETDFNTTNLSEEERKHTAVKTATLKSILSNRKNTASGPDGMSYQMKKQLPLEALEHLAQIIRTSIQLAHVPTQRKTAIIRVIPKVGRDHKTQKVYRPLSITSCLRKLCESIVNEHLVNHCEKLNLFGEQQSA